MRRGKSIFWGVVLLLAAAAILLGRLGYLKGIGFWTVLFSACLISFLVKGIIRRKIGTILFSLAFLIILNDELLHLEAITPWPILGAALLGTIGLKMLFPKLGVHRGGCLVRIEDVSSISECNQEGESFSYSNAFGESVKYISGVVSQVDIENAFGTTQVYFTEALLGYGTAHVNVDSAFGSVVLYVPQTWLVELDTQNVFASSGQKGKSFPDGKNILRVDGNVFCGSVEVVVV